MCDILPAIWIYCIPLSILKISVLSQIQIETKMTKKKYCWKFWFIIVVWMTNGRLKELKAVISSFIVSNDAVHEKQNRSLAIHVNEVRFRTIDYRIVWLLWLSLFSFNQYIYCVCVCVCIDLCVYSAYYFIFTTNRSKKDYSVSSCDKTNFNSSEMHTNISK